MRKKIGTAIEETVFRRLRVHAAQRGRSVSDVIEESISSYLALHEGSVDERMAAFERFTLRPLDVILEEDSLDQ
jgi:plasmid stability protein